MSGPAFAVDGPIAFRPVEIEEDLGLLERLLNDPELQRTDVATPPRPYDAGTIRGLYESRFAGSDSFAAIVTADGDDVGVFYVVPDERSPDTVEIGQQLLPEARDRGYGADALALMLSFCFERRGVRKVVARTVEFNRPARTHLERAGFTREGVHRNETFADGDFHDVVYYGLLASEWSE